MKITDWPASERPREKLLARGPEALSDAELLAILLRTGMAGKTVLDVARQLLLEAGSLGRLLSRPVTELVSSPGLGPAKACELAVVAELARRLLAEKLPVADALTSPQAVHDYLRLAYGMRVQEVVLLLCLDARNHLLAVEEVAHGTLTEARVYPREVVKAALRQHAAAVILAHNHPSGDTGPSLADRELTEELGRALALVDVRLLDHLVISRHGCTSFAECGWLPE
ncbi:MAG: DNA repair protein RadC [Laribacter sp.]|nr:DNA repair protein RadC [Laribacter sp.]MBP9526948.1 DNA repair protein RadC [Laribacter sp.]MBP9608251.1 DNA repair protein RadC [Laribacter sp.]